MFKKLLLFLSIFMVFASQCGNQENKSKQTITVWVHGTQTGLTTVLPAFFRTIPGMQPAKAYDKKNNLFTIAKTLSTTDPANFPFENIYLFGWSGIPSNHARKQAARQLYNELITLIEKYKQQYGTTPTVRIITHSHGGNVALRLAKINKKTTTHLDIDELILLACPVQQKTAHLISHDMFKKIYSLYSKADLTQVIDPQILYPFTNALFHYKKITRNLFAKIYKLYKEQTSFFSERLFVEQKNLTQKAVTINGRGLWHVEFILKKFVSRLPKMIID